MEYDRGDSVPLDYEPNGILLGSLSRGEMSLYGHIKLHFKEKKYIPLSVTKIQRNLSRQGS